MASKSKERDLKLERMKTALEAIRSIRVAAEKFQIPKSTLHDHISRKSDRNGAGRPTVLTEL